jgi:hypothetical protein
MGSKMIKSTDSDGRSKELAGEILAKTKVARKNIPSRVKLPKPKRGRAVK